jgi:hypothetical protein
MIFMLTLPGVSQQLTAKNLKRFGSIPISVSGEGSGGTGREGHAGLTYRGSTRRAPTSIITAAAEYGPQSFNHKPLKIFII